MVYEKEKEDISGAACFFRDGFFFVGYVVLLTQEMYRHEGNGGT
jgi:hypothetical protein